MPALQVRELPDEIYERLKAVAEAEHRSLAQQTIVALEHFLDTHEIIDGKVVAKVPTTAPAIAVASAAPQPFVPFERDGITYMTDPNETPEQRKARVDAIFERIAELPKIEVPDDFPSTAELIRQGWEERTDRILKAVEEGPW